MDTIQFLLRFNVAFILLVFLYDLLISDTAYHQFKRVFLLSAPVIAFCVALIAVVGISTDVLFTIELPMQEFTDTDKVLKSSDWSWTQVLVVLWIFGSLVQFIRLSIALRSIMRIQEADPEKGSFTFLRRIHIDPELDEDTRSTVLIHEQVHAQQLHSLDLIWFSILGAIFWFNPFFGLARVALKEVHEYIADAHTASLTMNYTNTLLASAFGISKMPMANEFNSINIKNRIRMLNKGRTRTQRHRIYAAIIVVGLISTSVACTSIQEEYPDGKVYEKVDEMPRFSGCEDNGLTAEELKKCAMSKLFEFMGSNVAYPKSAEKEGVEGKVLLAFVVDEKGKVIQAEIQESIDERLDAEALRVVELMPDWVPGVHQGKNVSVAMVLPVMFKLTD